MVLYGTKDPKAFDRGGTCLEILPSNSMKLHCWSKEKLFFFCQLDCRLVVLVHKERGQMQCDLDDFVPKKFCTLPVTSNLRTYAWTIKYS